MEKDLKDWRQNDPHDAEWFVAAGNFYYAKAREGAPLLSQSGQAGVVWCPPPATAPDPPAPNPAYFDRPLMTQAVTCWQAAIAAFPNRLNLPFKLAGLYQDCGDFEMQYSLLARALLYADKHRKTLEWEDGGDLPKPFPRLVPPLLEDAITYYLGGGGATNAERAHRLTRLDLTFFPNDPYAYNALAAYYSTREDWPRTLKYLLIAIQKAPKEGLFYFNIGNTLAAIGKEREARIFYRKAVRLGRNEPWAETARGHLESSQNTEKNN